MRDDTWIVYIFYPRYDRVGHWIAPYANFNVNRLTIQTVCGSLAVL